MIHFCKKCGTLYTDSLGECPKCNEEALLKAMGNQPGSDRAADSAPAPADRKTVRRQWIAILVGIPLFILFLKVVISLYSLFILR